MRASSTAIPRPSIPERPRLPRMESEEVEEPPRFPSWLGSESDAAAVVAPELDGFHLGIRGPDDTEPGWELHTAAGARIGRAPTCDVVLKDTSVSRLHAVIERMRTGRYLVRDLMSSNGLRVNGQVTRRWTLNEGDVIQIGPWSLHFGGSVLKSLPEDTKPRPSPDGVYGRTFAITKEAARQLSERSVNQRAFLQVLGDGHRLAGLRVCQYVIECDAMVIGADPEADLQLTSRLAPRICAVIVRNQGRFTLHPIAGWPFSPKLNGHRAQDVQLLIDQDELEVGGVKFRFRSGAPS